MIGELLKSDIDPSWFLCYLRSVKIYWRTKIFYLFLLYCNGIKLSAIQFKHALTNFGLVFLGTATLGSMIFPSSWCTGNLRTLSTAMGSLNVTNPKPRDRLVAGSFMTMTSASSPKVEKYSRIDSGVVCHDNPPINILPGSLGMSSPVQFSYQLLFL